MESWKLDIMKYWNLEIMKAWNPPCLSFLPAPLPTGPWPPFPSVRSFQLSWYGQCWAPSEKLAGWIFCQWDPFSWDIYIEEKRATLDINWTSVRNNCVANGVYLSEDSLPACADSLWRCYLWSIRLSILRHGISKLLELLRVRHQFQPNNWGI